jgi:predicted phage tail protein
MQADAADYTGQRRMAIRAKATSQLNGAIDTLSALCVAKCPVYDSAAGSWSVKATSNPAWWYLWWARGARDAMGRRRFGAGQDDARIDIEGIIEWAAWCDAKGLTFDWVLDQSRKVYEVLALIAKAGRASPSRHNNGKLGVVYAAEDDPVVAVFTPDNIKAGSLQIDWLSGDDLAEEIIVNYIDKTADYEAAQVQVLVPGVTNPRSSSTVDLIGCTSEKLAGQFANLQAASQVLHTRRVSFDTDIEGLLVRRGDVVRLSHDLTAWGASGRLLGVDGPVLTLDKAVDLQTTVGYLTLRGPDGVITTLRIAPGAGASSQLTVLDVMPAAILPGAGDDPLDWVWIYDPVATEPGQKMRVFSVQPSGDDTVKLVLVDEDQSYWAAIDGDYTALKAGAGYAYRHDCNYIKATASLIDWGAGGRARMRVMVRWGISHACPAELTYTINGTNKTVVAVDYRAGYGFEATGGDVIALRVVPKPAATTGITERSISYTVPVPVYAKSKVSGLSAVVSGVQVLLSWVGSAGDVAIDHYEVLYGASIADAVSVAKLSANTWSGSIDWVGKRSWFVRAVDVLGAVGDPACVDLTIQPPAQAAPSVEVIDNNVLLRCGDAKASLPIDHYELRKGDAWADAGVVGVATGLFSAIFEQSGGTYKYWVVGVDVAGNVGVPAGVSAVVSQPPDFVLMNQFVSDLSGLASNLLLRDGALIGPIDPSQTWGSHFASHGWSSIQDQIDAGYPRYLQPGELGASYEEVFDAGMVMNNTSITATLTYAVPEGSVTVTPSLALRKTEAEDWVVYPDCSQMVGSEFRYVRVRYVISAADRLSRIGVSGLTLKLSQKTQTDAGSGVALAADVGGTTVLFGRAFSAVTSIKVSAAGTTPCIMVYDFDEQPNPLSFRVLAFDTNGNRIDHAFGWSCDGVV